jgi:hypothetical protein
MELPYLMEVVRMGKAYCYCPKCKKMLTEVLSSFECLSTWDKAEDYYAPGDECKLVNRCPDCGTLTKEKERIIQKHELKKKTDIRPPHFKKKLKEIRHAV